jgi:glycosyltransferase involved in cell wall biosynthesis
MYVQPIRELTIPLHYFPASWSKVAKLRALRELIFQLNPEVIHSYSFHTNIIVYWAALGTKAIPIGAVRSSFGTDTKHIGNVLGKLCARWPRNQIFNNFAAAEKVWNSRTLFSPTGVFVVQNGVDLRRFPKVSLPTDSQIRILGIGSLLMYKRWDRLIRAAVALKKSGFEFRVEIAGDGPMRASLENEARDFGVADRINFVGYQKDVSKLLARSAFLAHTSDLEGCPNVIMEAMASGRAVVATDAGDIPLLVENGETGFIVPRGDDVQFLDRLATLISDRGLRCRMAHAGRVKAERQFGSTRLVEDTLAAYRLAGWMDFDECVALQAG